MSATNLTKNLKLSQFVASDKPSWLGDVNGDNKKIDDGYGVLAGEISKANDTASSAKSQSDANTQTLTNVNSELEDYGNRITALEAGGGTEQLEQRVNTLGSDVEALQTRADTFEENITQNGTDITALKSKIATIEPKVNANSVNITSLQSTTEDITATVENHSNRLTKAESDVTNALNKGNEALATANIASTNASSALSKVNNLESISSGFTTYSLANFSGAFTKVSPFYSIYTKNTANFLPVNVKLAKQFSTNEDIVAGTINIDNIASSITGIGESFAMESSERGIKAYFTANGTTLSLHIKATQQVGGINVAVTLYLPSVIIS